MGCLHCDGRIKWKSSLFAQYPTTFSYYQIRAARWLLLQAVGPALDEVEDAQPFVTESLWIQIRPIFNARAAARRGPRHHSGVSDVPVLDLRILALNLSLSRSRPASRAISVMSRGSDSMAVVTRSARFKGRCPQARILAQVVNESQLAGSNFGKAALTVVRFVRLGGGGKGGAGVNTNGPTLRGV